MRLSADLGDRMRPPESVIVRSCRATPGSSPRPRGSGARRDVQRSSRRPCRRGASETDSKTCCRCAVRRSAARCSVMSSTTAPTPITASGVGVGDRDGLVRQTGGQDVPDVATHLLCRADAIERSLRLVDVDEPKVPVHHRQPDPGRGVHVDPHAPGPRAVPLSLEALARRSCWILPRGRLTPTPPRDLAICPFYPATPGSSVRRVSCYRSTLAGEGRLTGRDRGLSSWPTAPKCGVRALFVGIIGCAACPRTHVWLDTLVSLQEEVQPYGGHEAADR